MDICRIVARMSVNELLGAAPSVSEYLEELVYQALRDMWVVALGYLRFFTSVLTSVEERHRYYDRLRDYYRVRDWDEYSDNWGE